MSRIGVFVCCCGENIAGTVDVERVAQAGRQPAWRALRAAPTSISAPSRVSG